VAGSGSTIGTAAAAGAWDDAAIAAAVSKVLKRMVDDLSVSEACSQLQQL
jgi:hypothetical protein